MTQLSGRTALITGAGQDVGAETAGVLAGHGARIIVNDLFEDRASQVVFAIRAAGGTAEPAVCDITDLAAVEKMAAAADDVDILVSNAGIPVTGFSSESARADDKRLAVYAASTGAGPAFIRSLAKEVGRYGITCNTLSLVTQNNAELDEASDMKLRQLKAYSIPRLGMAGDAVAAIAWLTSDNGSWVTGQTIPVNGGYASS